MKIKVPGFNYSIPAILYNTLFLLWVIEAERTNETFLLDLALLLLVQLLVLATGDLFKRFDNASGS